MSRSSLLRRALPAALLVLVAGSGVAFADEGPTSTDGTNVTLTLATGTITDTDGDGTTDPGDTIDFSITVTNIGGLDIKIDSLVTPLLTSAEIDVTCPSDWISPNATVTCTLSAPYTVTEADGAAGAVTLAGTVHTHIDDNVNDYTSSASLSLAAGPGPVPSSTPLPPTPVATLPDTGA
ncbi:MAG TPA: hypothetical protein VFE15_04220 [Marmoricola sp.]|jgi:hypothetical protein|nr:hypothetical protein [Marmoricola sp.]